jgi:hypothetical protein
MRARARDAPGRTHDPNGRTTPPPLVLLVSSPGFGVADRQPAAHVASALASAFLAGEWEPPAMARRAKRCLADRRAWLLELARITHAAYPTPPTDRSRELARFLAACDPFATAHANRDRPLRVHAYLAGPTAMASDGPFAFASVRRSGPRLDDLRGLAGWLGVSPRHLDWFADRRSMERTARDERLRHYHRRWVTRPGGSYRLLEAPKRELKDMQRMVLHHVLDRMPSSGNAHGFRARRSALTAARPHVGQAVVVRLDLESFFASVRAGRVYGLFRLAGYPEPVAHTLSGLCTTVTPPAVRRSAPGAAGDPKRRRLLQRLSAPHLPQGSPTSPALANLVAYRFDQRVSSLALRYGARYTRYADDLVLSGDRRLLRSVDRLVDTVAVIAADEGFRLNAAKTRLRTAAQRQTVMGLVVNDTLNVPREDYDRLRAILHDALHHGPAAANRAGHPDFRAHLLGRISWAAATSPTRATKLHRLFAAIDWGSGSGDAGGVEQPA